MHAAAGTVCGILGIALAAALVAGDVFSGLASGSTVETAVAGMIGLALVGLAAGSLAGGVMGRIDEQRGGSLAVGLGVALLGLLLYAAVTA